MNRAMMIVSNRLPVAISQDEQAGKWNIKAGSGGLVTALRPVLERHGGDWIGWPGDADGAPIAKLLREVGKEIGCRFHPVKLSPELIDGFYLGFSNETLWPLFHDLLGHAKFEEEKWLYYVESNRRFAKVIQKELKDDQVIWVHDYQLILVGDELRRVGIRNKIVYFLHIPFPPLDIYLRLPWRKEILRGLLAYDLIGFQSKRDRRNFLQCVRHFFPELHTQSKGNHAEVQMEDGRTVCFGAYPISIDFKDFDTRAKSKEVQDSAWYIHEGVPDRQMVLGVDRLDYTKGIPVKFLAFERALEKYPEIHGKISMVQILVPSRQFIPEYQRWKDTIDQIVGRVNGRFGNQGWVPLHYMYRSVSQVELLGYYRASEICLVTPLKDGMNLVCKEYCAASVDLNGVLILSEFAGAATQLGDGAMIVNPYDREAVADAIFEAYSMPGKERRSRMQKLRASIRKNDVYLWVDRFMESVEKTAARKS